MPERSSFGILFGSQRVKGSKTLMKSAQQHLSANLPLISNKLSCVSWLLVRSEILGPFSKMLTADHKYPCHNWEKLSQQVQPQLSSKRKTFFASFVLFLKSI